MSQKLSPRIVGTGSALPERVVTNFDLSKIVETNHDWIVERSGISTRRIANPARREESNVGLAATASRMALSRAGLKPENVDLIIYASSSTQGTVPSMACRLQKELGVVNGAAFDINAACSGFVFALSIAHQFLKSGTSQTAIVVGSEVLTSMVDWTDRGTCVLFGDGAGAVVLQNSADTVSAAPTFEFDIRSEGQHCDLIATPLALDPSKRDNPWSEGALVAGKVHMRGSEVFKLASRAMVERAQTVLQRAGVTVDQVSLVIPHQANIRILKSVAEYLKVPIEKVFVNLEKYGNTSSASLPIALNEAVETGRIKPGDQILMLVFGAGVTSGACLIRW
jgi:3-oxoacyl-[acyl-carrier-protein] synthase-3